MGRNKGMGSGVEGIQRRLEGSIKWVGMRAGKVGLWVSKGGSKGA